MGQRDRTPPRDYRRPYVEPPPYRDQFPIEGVIAAVLIIGGGLGLLAALIQNFWWDGISESVGSALAGLERELQNISR